MYDKRFNKFEREVMKAIIAENPEISELLEKQYRSAKVVSREFTGVGFFIGFDVTDKNSRLPEYPNNALGRVQAKFKELEYGVGFVLFIREGFIVTLEGFTYDEPWPENIEGYVLEEVWNYASNSTILGMMTDNILDRNMQNLYDIYAKFCDKINYTKDENVASKSELLMVEEKLGHPIPPSLKEFFIKFSKSMDFYARFCDSFKLDGDLSEIFCAEFTVSIDELINAEESRLSWIDGCFSNVKDPFDKVWHNKLGFMTVGNGDVLAFDLNDDKEDKRVVYLSHDGMPQHGYVLGESFGDFFTKYLLIGACGKECWLLDKFMDDGTGGINPNCDNAKKYKEIIGLRSLSMVL